MTDEAAERRDVTDDVSTMMTSPAGRYDFSITNLLNSSAADAAKPSNKHTDGSAVKSSSAVAVAADSAFLLRQRLAAAALWYPLLQYPWLHSVASLQSASNQRIHSKLHLRFTVNTAGRRHLATFGQHILWI